MPGAKRISCVDCGTQLHWARGWCKACWDDNQALLSLVYGHDPLPRPHPGPQQRRPTCARGHPWEPGIKHCRTCKRDAKRRQRARAAAAATNV